jgi:hypothetical protein
VALRDVMAGVRIVRRVKVPAGRFAVRRGTIAEFVNMKSMFARCEPGDIGYDFRFIARLRERDDAFHVAVFRGVEDSNGFGRFAGHRGGCYQREGAGSEQA